MDFISRKNTRKYTSQPGDLVIGLVLGRQGDYYQIDINDRFTALLQYYDFEGATKRNRPHLETGSLIFAKVKSSNPCMNAVLTCSSSHNKKSWSSGEAEYGPLQKGYLSDCSVPLCQFLLSGPGKEFLSELGEVFKFELIVGYNGKLWVSAPSPMQTILLANTILKADTATQEELSSLLGKVKKLA